jgi:putative membrane protein
MRTARLALLELRRVLSVRKIRLAISVVALVPLLYGGLYLWAFWDPYSRLDQLPVAIVNLDQGAVANEETIAAGSDLVAELQKSKTFAWRLVSAGAAKEGLADHEYQIALTIPVDFSAALASATGDTPRKARLLVQNQGTNILVSQITERALGEVRTAVAAKASATYLNNIYVSFAQMHDGLQSAARSAGELATGLQSAKDGASALQTGIASADSGAAGLSAGVSELATGAGSLKTGAESVAAGSSTLASKLGTAVSGAKTLSGGAASAAAGATSLSAGLRRLDDSGATLSDSAATVAGGASQVSAGAGQIAAGTEKAAAAAGRLNSGAKGIAQLLAGLEAAHPELAGDPTLAAAKQAAGAVSAGAGTLAGSLDEAASGTRDLVAGSGALKTGSALLSAGISDYVDGVHSAAKGAADLSTGLGALKSGAAQLAAGIRTADAGAAKLAEGAANLATGAGTLASGAGSAQSGALDLSDGLETLAAGSAALATGLGDGTDGARKLADGLGASASQVPDDSEDARAAKAEVMSSPVSLQETTSHPISNYGTGFAPYFIPLALWVGALMAFFLVRSVSSRALASTASDWTVAVSGYWPGALVVTVQAVIMALVLQFGLGLHLANAALFYAFCVFVSLVFVAIMQLLTSSLGTPGKFVAIVLLMLQLTSAAGTFPLETVPRFFQVINPFLPMTYVVLGLREVITTGDVAALARDMGFLLIFAALAFAATLLTVRRKRVWTMERLKPAMAI